MSMHGHGHQNSKISACHCAANVWPSGLKSKSKSHVTGPVPGLGLVFATMAHSIPELEDVERAREHKS